jgi:F-type H+-transporting ATPase subunit gamma
MARYSIVEEDVLPLLNAQEKNEPKATYIFEPEEDVVASYLLERGLMAEILRVILETAASEQAARMTAMSQASENAQDLIKQLTLAFNKARQAIITRELSEIIGTTTALGS